MGKKKRINKDLESQLKLSEVFNGVFDAQLIASLVKEAEGDYDVAMIRLTELSSVMFSGDGGGVSAVSAVSAVGGVSGGVSGGGGGVSSGVSSGVSGSNSSSGSHENKVDSLFAMFPSYDREVISFMLDECNGVVEDVVDIISRDHHVLPPSQSNHQMKSSLTSDSSTNIISSDLQEKDVYCTLTTSEHHVEDDKVESPLQIMKYMLMDFLPSEKIDKYLQDKDCSECSTVEHLQRCMNDILLFVSVNTTCADMLDDSENDSATDMVLSSTSSRTDIDGDSNIVSDTDLDMFLFESTLHFDSDTLGLNGDSPSINMNTNHAQFKEAKRIVRSFFKKSDKFDKGVSPHVPESMIEAALELSKTSSVYESEFCPDAAIGWICEELNAKHQVITNPTNDGKWKQTPATYASKLLTAPVETRKVARSFGGDSEKVEDSNPQVYEASQKTRCMTNLSLDINDMSFPASSNINSREMAQHWRNIHQNCKSNMLQYFSAAASTRSKNTVVSGQHFKHEMYHAAAECSKYELMVRNPDIRVENNGSFVEFIGFNSKHTPRKVVSIDMHGVDVRSGVQFVKSLVENCYRCGNHVLVLLVVGVGNNSIRNIPKLKPAVTSFLKSNSKVKYRGCEEGRIDFYIGN